jgi:hypothetical protein
MVTGGFRTVDVMEETLRNGELDVVGLGRPFCINPDFPRQVFEESLPALPSPERAHRLGPGIIGPGSSNKTVRALNSQASTAWFYKQIYRLADDEEPDLGYGLRRALGSHLVREQKKAFSRKRRGK